MYDTVIPLPQGVPVEETVGWVKAFSAWLVDLVHSLGYLGVFIMTFLESTFVPIPAEVTMVPAGYLIQQGVMDFWPVFIASVAGTLFGSLFNYWLALRYGRPLLENYGKYVLLTPKKMAKIDEFFAEHGEVSTFSGRLIPGLRHFIAFPAGLARMNLRKFCLYTSTGGAIWMGALLWFGYEIGSNKALVDKYIPLISAAVLGLTVLLVLGYVWYYRRVLRKRRQKAAPK